MATSIDSKVVSESVVMHRINRRFASEEQVRNSRLQLIGKNAQGGQQTVTSLIRDINRQLVRAAARRRRDEVRMRVAERLAKDLRETSLRNS